MGKKSKKAAAEAARNAQAEKAAEQLTTAAGAPVADNRTVKTAGPHGPALLEDVWLLEKMAHFNREVIPERRMHAKGWGAYGFLRITADLSRYTRAQALSAGAQNECFVRFSTVAGERGAADTERDIRGFAMKVYSPEGNWDLVGNNTPTFFLRDAHDFPGLNRAVKRDPHTGRRNAQSNWDFWTMLPEALLQITITMSDKGIPDSFRRMDCFGEHTFSLYNEANERTWCKFHFLTQQGLGYLTDAQAAQIAGQDREFHGRDLYEAIERGDFPRWKLYLQLMTEEQAIAHYENPFDVTKPWREEEFPLIEAGELVLNRNPENFFAEVEQAAFNPAHVVPGIGFSPDRLLQGRLFAYGDAQRYRLGVNHAEIPVNRPKRPAQDNHRDGAMRTDGNFGALPAYTPNSLGLWRAAPGVREPPLALEGAAWRFDPALDETDDTARAPGELYRSMSAEERNRLIANTARSMQEVNEGVRLRHAARCLQADTEYGTRMAQELVLDLTRVRQLAALPNAGLIRETGTPYAAQG